MVGYGWSKSKVAVSRFDDELLFCLFVCLCACTRVMYVYIFNLAVYVLCIGVCVCACVYMRTVLEIY